MYRKLRWLLPLLGGASLLSCKSIEAGKAQAGHVGASCQAKDDCTEVDQPVCLKEPGGYCSSTCSGSGLFECDSESICQDLGQQKSFCMDGCLTENGSGDCRDEYRCEPRPDVSNSDGKEVGVCLPKCQSDADCPTGRRCDTQGGTCVARGSKKTGAACSSDAPCNGGLCLKGDTFNGGYCSAHCGDQFSACEPGSFCVATDGNPVCLAQCDGDGDCRGNEGYKCRQIATHKDKDHNDVPVKVCVPRCQSNDECADGQHCDVQSGDCVDGVGDPNPLGAFCSGDGDCATGSCVHADGWPNGYCTSGCQGNDDCDGGVCGNTPNGAGCLAACQGDLDCRSGYICLGGGCVGRCHDDSACGDGLTCNTRTGRCVAQGMAGSSHVQTLDVASNVPV
jgi:hypothetical protein